MVSPFVQKNISGQFLDILKALSGENENERENTSLEYQYCLNLLQEFDKRLRHVEMLFDNLYARTAALEKYIEAQRD